MNLTIFPQRIAGTVAAIPAKSQAHRLLICAALGTQRVTLLCPRRSRDMEATARCLNALGARITETPEGFAVTPIDRPPRTARLEVGESGSTLRFLLPVAGALGVDACFCMEGRLPQRPLSPLWEELTRMGLTLSRPTPDTVRCTGQLRAGKYKIDGSVSSQFVSGLLFAARILGNSSVEVTGTVESAPYIAMTREAIDLFSRPVPERLAVEGDWSNAAFFLAAAALGSRVEVTGLREDSAQGDRAVAALLPRLRAGNARISARDIPDLVPILAVTAAVCHGAEFTDIRRLRLKESDRVAAVTALLAALGGRAEAGENTLLVAPSARRGGTADSFGHHRIAMAAAIAATACTEPVTILGAQAVDKSYPDFWCDYAALGGRLQFEEGSAMPCTEKI